LDEAQRWAAWLTHVSSRKTRKGAKAEAWAQKNAAMIAELGEGEVLGAIKSWFVTPLSREKSRPLPKANAHLALGLLFTAADSAHPASNQALAAAFCILPDRGCNGHWRAAVTALLDRDTLDAYLAYFETGRPTLLENDWDLSRKLTRFEKNSRPLARALTLAASTPDEAEIVDHLTTLAAEQLTACFYESSRLSQISKHVRAVPAGVSPDVFRHHADRLIAACRPTYLDTLKKVLKLRKSADLPLEPEETVRLALFELEHERARVRMNWVIDEGLAEHVEAAARASLSPATEGVDALCIDFGSALIIARKLDEAVALLELALGVREHAALHYNLACALTLLGDLDRALPAIARSFALNPGHRQFAADDDELAALRADPRFSSL
jgi:tetratricopeptide (TPR) repeat protein